jgi:hypothetical protein
VVFNFLYESGHDDTATSFDTVGDLTCQGGLEDAEVMVVAVFWLLDTSRWNCGGGCVIYLRLQILLG